MRWWERKAPDSLVCCPINVVDLYISLQSRPFCNVQISAMHSIECSWRVMVLDPLLAINSSKMPYKYFMVVRFV